EREPMSDPRKTHRDYFHAIARMYLKADKVSGRLMCTTDFDDFHDHDIFIPDKGFFHIEVGITDGADPYKGIFLERIGMERDKDGLAVIHEGLAVGKEGKDGIGLGIFSKKRH